MATIATASLLAACAQIYGSGPPGCSDEDVVDILAEMLQEEGEWYSIALNMGVLGYGEMQIFSLSPDAVSKLQQDEVGDALLALERAVNQLPDDQDGIREGWEKIIAASKETTHSISALSTVEQTERRSSCSFTVNFNMGIVSDGRQLDNMSERDREDFLKLISLKKEITASRNFETYFTDDGDIYVELNAADLL